jgi:hypothetical protein
VSSVRESTSPSRSTRPPEIDVDVSQRLAPSCRDLGQRLITVRPRSVLDRVSPSWSALTAAVPAATVQVRCGGDARAARRSTSTFRSGSGRHHVSNVEVDLGWC